jgi:2-polyprenyl-3-methyl-5-hydroxy-6-metoxy-1,4-benzoquinol methylase
MSNFSVLLIGALILMALYLLTQAHALEKFDGAGGGKEDGAPTEERHDYEAIYDDFYAGVYDKLFETPGLISFQKASIREYALNEWAKKEVKLLDVCCGTAPLAEWLCSEDVDVVGV